MKKLKIVRAFLMLLCFSFLFTLQLGAQSEPTPYGLPPGLPSGGYVVLNNGDTIHGNITWKLKYVENNPVEIKLKTQSGVSETYAAGEIHGFGFCRKVWMEDNPVPVIVGYEHYVSLPSFRKGVPVFLCRLLDGRIKVFLNRSSFGTSSRGVEEIPVREDGINFSFSSEYGLRIGQSYRIEYKVIEGKTRCGSYFVVKDDGKMIKVEKDNYKEVYELLFGDCPAISDEVSKNPDLTKFKNFMILAEVYNQICR
ncbi:MAG TPA: hypothetical protein PKH02_11620 [Bacteroidales bacterium]|nr:hypothetical protein [Bacteroidales bacterium]